MDIPGEAAHYLGMRFRHVLIGVVCLLAALGGGGLGRLEPPRAFAALRVWTGGGTNSNWMNPDNWNGPAPVAGDILRFPPGAARLSNNNNFPAGTSFEQIQITGSGYTLDGNRVSIVTLLSSSPASGVNAVDLAISGSGDVISNGGGRLDLSGNNSFTGDVRLATGALRVKSANALGSSSGKTFVDATSQSSGGLQFEGTFAISEVLDLARVTSGALMHIEGGSLTVNANMLVGPGGTGIQVTGNLSIFGDIGPGGITMLGGGQTGVSGNVPGGIEVADGLVSLEGDAGSVKTSGGLIAMLGTTSSLTSPSGGVYVMPRYTTLTVNGPTTFSAASGFGVGLNYPILPTPRLVTSQAPTLGNAHFLVDGDAGPIGGVWVIVRNTSGQPINGTFLGAPEGSTVAELNGVSFRISYIGGSGNDITLTVIDPTTVPPPTSADLKVTASGTPDPAAAGSNVVFTSQLSNLGPALAHDVVWTAQVVQGETFVSLDPGGPNLVCSTPAVGAIGQVRCTRDQLAVGITPTISFTVRINNARTADLVTPFSVSASTADPAMGNNDVSVTTHIAAVTQPPPVGTLQFRRFVPLVATD